MPENQRHGFDYQDKILETFNIKGTTGYTDKWDGYENIFDITMPDSIKCSKLYGEIGLGDIRRISQINEDFILYSGHWEGRRNNIVEEYRVKINKDNWKSYLGNIKCFENLYAEMDTISNDRKDDAKWKDFCKKYKTIYGEDAVISIRFKRDHKK